MWQPEGKRHRKRVVKMKEAETVGRGGREERREEGPELGCDLEQASSLAALVLGSLQEGAPGGSVVLVRGAQATVLILGVGEAPQDSREGW